jgi:transcriptional regulator with XRE-family HTH domain
MRPQTLQRIEDGSTKTLSATARRMLAPALQVREDQLLVPVGRPIEPLEGESPPMLDLIYQALLDVAAELRMLREMLQQMPKREI